MSALTQARINAPVVDLLRQPDGPRDRQLLLGDSVSVLEAREAWSHVRAKKDGYLGYVPSGRLSPAQDATHWVCAPATHAYAAMDFKSPDLAGYSFGTRLVVSGETERFAETDQGFVPKSHLRAVGDWYSDPITVAEKFLGTPYLWGGNSRFGIDCSGLVQAACLACGLSCPGDSGPQEQALGHSVNPGDPHERGDLLFWRGHVAWVWDAQTLLHANAFAMAVVFEPLQPAIERIAAQGDGPVTAHKRLS